MNRILFSERPSVTVEVPEWYHPGPFFRRHPGFVVCESFEKLILPKAKPAKNLSPITLRPLDLREEAYERDVKTRLSVSPALSELELCACIEQMVTMQDPLTEEGHLLNPISKKEGEEQYAFLNLFFTADCIVHLGVYHGRPCGTAWAVTAVKESSALMYPGTRVFP